MGQQQLLLLVLGMVIVGIAVVAGIQAFSEGKAKADRDAAISDAMRVISDIQAWKLKPSAFGGGSDASGFTGLEFNALGISAEADGTYLTQNGCFEITNAAASGATLTVSSVTTASGTPACGDKIADVTIADATVDGITWTYGS